MGSISYYISHQSSVINHQSSIINYQWSIINDQWSIISHHSSVIIFCRLSVIDLFLKCMQRSGNRRGTFGNTRKPSETRKSSEIFGNRRRPSETGVIWGPFGGETSKSRAEVLEPKLQLYESPGGRNTCCTSIFSLRELILSCPAPGFSLANPTSLFGVPRWSHLANLPPL